MSKTLRLGMIGLSDGNGHPYSWGAIFNGYDSIAMEACGYPVIPRYLERQLWPDDCIDYAEVTHIWTQDFHMSESIAKTVKIKNPVAHMEAMIGHVDGILLARDDAESHLSIASVFLKAGLPVYIDKPICLSLNELKKIFSYQQYSGQIFSCSALHYAKELQLTDSDKRNIGQLQYIQAIVPKDWDKYSIHIIDPIVSLIGDQGALLSSDRHKNNDICSVQYTWESGFQASITSLGDMAAPISIRVIGSKGWKDLNFSDTFSAFKSALVDFTEGILCKDERIPYKHLERCVEILEQGYVKKNIVYKEAL